MNLQTRKNIIIQYILDAMPEDDFERGEGAMGFQSYQDFVNFQHAAVNNSDIATIELMEFVMRFIQITDLMDKESMVEFNASGFAINSDGRYVLFNER